MEYKTIVLETPFVNDYTEYMATSDKLINEEAKAQEVHGFKLVAMDAEQLGDKVSPKGIWRICLLFCKE